MCKNNVPIEKKQALRRHALSKKAYIDAEFGTCEVYLHGPREVVVYLVIETGKYYVCYGGTTIKEFTPNKEKLTRFIST